MVGSRRRQRYHKSARLTDSHIWNTCAGDDTGTRRMSSSPKSGTAPERTPMPVTQDVPPHSRAPQPVVGAWPLGITASPIDFQTRRAIGFQQSGEAGTFSLSAGRSVTRTTDPPLR